LKNRQTWKENWYEIVQKPMQNPNLNGLQNPVFDDNLRSIITGGDLPSDIQKRNPNFQPGESLQGGNILNLFLNGGVEPI
jgi:hypothetical protein